MHLPVPHLPVINLRLRAHELVDLLDGGLILVDGIGIIVAIRVVPAKKVEQYVVFRRKHQYRVDTCYRI
jgi:hypothetical protein